MVRNKAGFGRCIRSLLVLSVIACSFFGRGTALAQSETERRSARAAARAGDQALREQRYQEALELFIRAEELVHAPTLVLRVARAYAGLGRYVRAKETYLLVLREQLPDDAPQAFIDAQLSARNEVSEVAARIGTLRLSVEGPERHSLALTLDGELLPNAVVGLAYPLDPGRHTVRLEAKGFIGVERAITIEDGQASVLDVVLAPAAQPAQLGKKRPMQSPASVEEAEAPAVPEEAETEQNSGTSGMRIAAYTGLGVGVLGTIGGVAFNLRFRSLEAQATNRYKSCVDNSPGGDCQDPRVARQDEDTKREQDRVLLYGLSSYVVGGLGIGAAAAFYFLSPEFSSQVASVAPYYDGSFIGVTGQF